MATNELTPEQDLLTRDFYVSIAEDSSLFPNSPSYARQLRAICLELLNYNQLPNGAFISKGITITTEFGSKDYSPYPDEWADDYDKAVAAIAEGATDGTDYTDSEPETDTRSESTYTKVRKALLSEDV